MERERERVYHRKYLLYFYDFCPVPVFRLHHLTLTVWSAANSLPSHPFLPTLVSLVMRFSLVSLTWGKMGWQAMTCGSGMAFHKKDSWWQLLSMVHARWTEKLPEVPSFDARSAQNIRGWSDVWPSEFPRPVYTVACKNCCCGDLWRSNSRKRLCESMLLALCLYSAGGGTYDLIVCS